MKLKVLSRYTNTARNIDVYPGDEIEVRDELAAWLANDAPGCFAVPGQEAAAVEQDEQKPFDLPPDGTTLLTDATPPVITGPESGVEIVHRADADEQQAVLDEQTKLAEEEAEAEEEEGDKTKAPTAPPKDKMVKGAPKQK
jgi:hypothetical protein